MEDQQKTRLMLLVLSLLMLSGVVGVWLWYHNQNVEKANQLSNETVQQPVSLNNKLATAAGQVQPDNVAKRTTIAPGTVNPVLIKSPGIVQTPPGAAPLNAKPIVQNPINQNPANKTISATPTAAATLAPGITAPAIVSAEAKQPGEQGPAPKSNKFPALKREEAVIAAKQLAGRQDPMMPISESGAWPVWSKPTGAVDVAAAIVPPPPPIDKPVKNKKIASSAKDRLVPPPPPTVPSGMMGGAGDADLGLPIAQLPAPPDKPSIAGNLKLCAVIGNKAIIAIPSELRFQNKWPSTISLGPGEQFESISIVSVDPDSVTIDEDGERSIKTLSTIK